MPNLVTFNMQGSNAATEVKWQTGVANLMASGASVICLQECGAPPPSAEKQPGSLAGNDSYSLYYWGNERTRKYISYYLWDNNGNRCNLAIVSRFPPTDWQCLPAVGGPGWRPVIGAQINGIWYFCLHAISPGGPDAGGLLAAVAAAVNDDPWIVAGDFNREPQPPLPTGNVCPPNESTYSTENPQRRYDYAYKNGDVVEGTVLNYLNLSDHFPVWYPMP